MSPGTRLLLLPVLGAALTLVAAQRSAPLVPNTLSAAPSVDNEAHRVLFSSGVSLRYPKTWTVSHALSNAVELAKPSRKDGVTLRSLLFLERCRNHEDALQRLQSIAASREEPPSFLAIAGWPALQRTYPAPLAEPNRDSPNVIGDDSPSQSRNCTIRNHRVSTQCLTACSAGEGKCRAATHDAHDRQECIASEKECDKGCQ